MDDLPRLHDWLARPHVRRWYAPEPATYEQVAAKYGPRTRDGHPVRSYLILLDDREIGYVQSYDADDAGGVGVDLFIGEPEHVGRGVGAEALRRFVDEVVFGREGARFCIADPNPENRASIRAFEKAGFRPRGKSTDTVHLLRRDREADDGTA
jgi:RimJ/RimL family protein N-acetyltransferase